MEYGVLCTGMGRRFGHCGEAALEMDSRANRRGRPIIAAIALKVRSTTITSADKNRIPAEDDSRQHLGGMTSIITVVNWSQ